MIGILVGDSMRYKLHGKAYYKKWDTCYHEWSVVQTIYDGFELNIYVECPLCGCHHHIPGFLTREGFLMPLKKVEGSITL
jgi:hypothetical protein